MSINDGEYNRAAVILNEVAKSNERLITLAQSLRADPEVVEVKRGLDCRNYESGLTLEEYVEAELKDGMAVCWWLDVHQEERRWLISGSISVNGDAGHLLIKDFPGGAASTVDEFADMVRAVTNELVSSSSKADLLIYRSMYVEKSLKDIRRNSV